jgi:cytoskeleton protein RodZ
MPSIGEALREARMRQRLDISDVEDRTKIRAKYLRALENEEFGLLPGPTFVKTFLRTYSEALGLDPHLLVEEYRANYEPAEDPELQPLPSQPPPGGRESERRYPAGPPGRATIIVGAVVALFALLLILGLTGEEDDDGSDRSAATTTETGPAKRARRRRPARKPRPSTITLQVRPTGPTYVCVDRGPGTEEIFEGTINVVQTFRGKKLRINLGRTAVDLRVNGKPFPLEETANPVGYEFSRTGSKELDQGQRPTCA